MNRKGFYFSFDSLLALSIMIASLAVLYQSSAVETDPFVTTSITYERASMNGQDAMKLASKEDFYVFNSSYRNQLTSTTAIDEEDLDRPIIDGITLLWAARNFTAAEQVSKNYLDSKIPDEFEYRLQVNEGNNSTVIYESKPLPSNPEAVTSISRLVSGHSIDKPSEGYQARARATDIVKNETKSFIISSEGGATGSGELIIDKKFNLSAQKVWNSTFYLAPHYGCDNSDIVSLSVNGEEYDYDDIDWIDEIDTCSSWYTTGRGAFGKIEMNNVIEPGINNVTVAFRNPEYNAHTQPGFRIEVKHENKIQNEISNLEHKKIYFSNIESGYEGSDSGLFAIKGYELPQNADLKNATLNVNASGIERECADDPSWWFGLCNNRYDIRVLHDDEILYRGKAAANGSYTETFDITDETQSGTNLVSLYFNMEGDVTWANQNITLHSDFETENSSYIEVWYEEEGGLEFGTIEVTETDYFGQTGDPIEYSVNFEDRFGVDSSLMSLKSVRLYPTQLTGYRIEAEVWDVGEAEQEVFVSPASRAIPASIFVDPSYYDLSNQNNARLNDLNNNIFQEKSGFEYTLQVPSQVGYGELFENQSAADKDAKERLENVLGPFIKATNIDTDSVDTGNQPYLWGPASVRLVIWNE